MLRNLLTERLRFFGLERTSEELAREQFRLLAQQIPVLYTVVLINSWFMAFATGSPVGISTAFIFPIIATPIMVYRGLYWYRYADRDVVSMPIKEIRKSLRSTVIMANVLAVMLGIWVSFLLWATPQEYKPFIPLFTLLSMISCAYCLNGLPLAAYSILTSGSAIVVSAMLLTGNNMLVAMSANIIVVSIMIVYMVAKQYAQIRRLVSSRSKIIEQRSYANELAYQDQLTGLPNRRAMLKALHEILEDEPDTPVAMLMLDMNGFKSVNDTYGHAAGDHLLTTVGQRLKAIAGEAALIARLGGDEFAILICQDTNANRIYNKAEVILHEISKPLVLEDHELHIGTAIGIAIEHHMPDDPLELLRHADIALYEAKGKENSQISMFEGSMEARVKRRTLIEQALSDREEMQDITLNYQPFFRMKDGAHVGFEALARWQHPELGEIRPAEFVDTAERNGLAARLTIHLFRQAIDTAKLWDDDIHLSFNLSGSGLGTSDLDILLPDIIREKNFDPSRLHVEVTETALLGNFEPARRVLSKLHDLGVKIVLDDFGAGYASIGYLREMPFDGIKLDGSLIGDIDRNERSRQLLIGVLHLCRAIGTKVTAEMVESEEQLALLRTLPIENMQGYLLGRPVKANATLKEDVEKREYRRSLFS